MSESDSLQYVCTLCGHRQETSDPCGSCGDDSPLDLRKEQTVQFLHEIDQRARDKREGQVRAIGVAVGMVIILGLWTQPWWWDFRYSTIALPFFADQIAYMVLLAFGTIALLNEVWPAPRRFPWLEEL